jgi:hypothetical protein
MQRTRGTAKEWGDEMGTGDPQTIKSLAAEDTVHDSSIDPIIPLGRISLKHFDHLTWKTNNGGKPRVVEMPSTDRIVISYPP